MTYITIPNDQYHHIIRYVLKIGDVEEAAHTFLDLLEMEVLNHENFDFGSSDGNEAHYNGPWSRTVIGYSKDILHGPPCLQLTMNRGIMKYTRGNFLEALEIQGTNSIMNKLKDAGIELQECRGKKAYVLTCDGYTIHVVKSPDDKNRISRVILNCDDPLSLSGPTVTFWTSCLGFEISSWSSHPSVDKNVQLVEYTNSRYDNIPCRACCFPWFVKQRANFKTLKPGEQPYVELQYGSSTHFYVRLQELPPDTVLDKGSGNEKLMMTCTQDIFREMESRIATAGRAYGGSGFRRSFQLVPGRGDLDGIVATDANGLGIVVYCYQDVVEVSTSQLDADSLFRQFMDDCKRLGFESRRKSGRLSSLLHVKFEGMKPSRSWTEPPYISFLLIRLSTHLVLIGWKNNFTTPQLRLGDGRSLGNMPRDLMEGSASNKSPWSGLLKMSHVASLPTSSAFMIAVASGRLETRAKLCAS